MIFIIYFKLHKRKIASILISQKMNVMIMKTMMKIMKKIIMKIITKMMMKMLKAMILLRILIFMIAMNMRISIKISEIANAIEKINSTFHWNHWMKLIIHFWTRKWIKRKWNCSCQVTQNKKNLLLILTRNIEIQLFNDNVYISTSTIISMIYQLKSWKKTGIKKWLK